MADPMNPAPPVTMMRIYALAVDQFAVRLLPSVVMAYFGRPLPDDRNGCAARTGVGPHDVHGLPVPFGGQVDVGLRRRVVHRVLDQIPQDVVQLAGISLGVRGVVGNLDAHPLLPRLEARRQVGDDGLEEAAGPCPAAPSARCGAR